MIQIEDIMDKEIGTILDTNIACCNGHGNKWRILKEKEKSGKLVDKE